VPSLPFLSFRPFYLIRSLVEFTSLRSIGLIHLNRPGMIAPLSPVIAGHMIGTIEAPEFSAGVGPTIFMAVHSAIHLPVFLPAITAL
jgi:hypothetical protein